MAEVDKTFEENQVPQSAGEKFKASFKEWARKQIVSLKRSPQRIPLFFFLATSIYFMFSLFVLSQACFATANNAYTFATGITMFISTLLSILILVSFLNAFPKRKKPSIPFIILVFLMIGAIIACDLVYYLQMNDFIVNALDTSSSTYELAENGQPFVIAHIVLLAISTVVFILLPVYKRLINKIDTSVQVESATEHMKGSIDINEE